MKKALTILAAGLMLGAFAASQAKLPPPPAKTDAEKKAEADKYRFSTLITEIVKSYPFRYLSTKPESL